VATKARKTELDASEASSETVTETETCVSFLHVKLGEDWVKASSKRSEAAWK